MWSECQIRPGRNVKKTELYVHQMRWGQKNQQHLKELSWTRSTIRNVFVIRNWKTRKFLFSIKKVQKVLLFYGILPDWLPSLAM